MSKTTRQLCLATNRGISSSTIAAALTAIALTLTSGGVFAKHSMLSDVGDQRGSVKVNKDSRNNFLAGVRLVKQSPPTTERAKDFNSRVRSEKYWKGLYASIAKPKSIKKPSKTPKTPPVVIGSRD